MVLLQFRAPTWGPDWLDWQTLTSADTLAELAAIDSAGQAIGDGELFELPGCPWSGDYTTQPECLAIDAAAEGVSQCIRWLVEFGISDADAVARCALCMPYGIEVRLALG